MKAQHKPRIDLVNRTKLETVIPLSTPFIVFVDPSDRCNFQCKFCPTGNRELMRQTPGRNHGRMDFDAFKKIIKDIKDFPQKIKVLRLYKDGEPLLNPDFAKMVAYARDAQCCERIDTTTNASLLNKKLIHEIIDGGLSRMNVSIEGMNKQQYKKFSGYTIDFAKLVENITYLYENKKQCEIIIKINGDIISNEDKELFYTTFGNIADGVSVEHVMSCWPEFNLEGVEVNPDVGIFGQPIQNIQVCPYVFYSIAVNADLSVSACFLDWERHLILGNISHQSLGTIWNGPDMQRLRRLMLARKRHTHPVCQHCGQMSHGAADNLDAFADALLPLFEEAYEK
ncbi:MAG: GTP 3',8-cyclase [Desulfovibrio sp.]